MSAARITAVPRPPDRADDSHKGDFGRVLIVAGSRGMAGAAALCGLGALRGGAGLVTVACPASLANTVTAIEPGLMTVPLPEQIDAEQAERLKDGSVSATGHLDVLRTLQTDAAAIGPGLGRRAVPAVMLFWSTYPEPAVFDADALNALSSLWPTGMIEERARSPRVLTPHPGEFARLLGGGMTAKDLQADRETLAVRFAADHGVVLLLKGHRTLITDGDRLFENRTGNPGMATGGAGDVLTGLLAALIGLGMDPFDAACCAAHLHGRAGDLAAAALSRPGLIASDLPRYIAKAFADPAFPAGLTRCPPAYSRSSPRWG